MAIDITITLGLSPTLEAWVQLQTATTLNALTRIEAKLNALTQQEQRLMTLIEELTAAVNDNIAAQTEANNAILAEDLNIEAAIAKLAELAGNNPAVAAQIHALKAATASQRANTQLVIDENVKLAAALGPVAQP